MDSKKNNIDNWRRFLEVSMDLSSSLDVDSALHKISASASSLVSAEGSSILLFDDERSCLYFKAASGEKTPILRKTQVTGGIAWCVAQTGEPAIINNTSGDHRFTGTVDNITGFETKNILCVPVMLKGEIIGALEAINKIEGDTFTESDLKLFSMLANQVAIVIKNAQMLENQQNFFINGIELLVKAIESIGVIIGMMSVGHCWRVAEIATAIGQHLELDDTEFDYLYYGAVLHDIGILEEQPGGYLHLGFSYDENSVAWVKSHTVVGANMIENIVLLSGAKSIIRHHHENYDGTGYPDGLEEDEIPLGARIVAVAELYEQRLLNGSNSAISTEANDFSAIQKVKESASTILDPLLVDIFLQYKKGEEIPPVRDLEGA